MSGHSKWATIKHKKGAKDIQRGQGVRQAGPGGRGRRPGGRGRPGQATPLWPRPSRRPRPASMPNDNIERAIKRGIGRRRRRPTTRRSGTRGTPPGGWRSTCRCSPTTATGRPSRRALHLHPQRRQPGRTGLGRLPVRAEGVPAGRRGARTTVMLAALDAGRRGRAGLGRPVGDHHRSRRPRAGCARALEKVGVDGRVGRSHLAADHHDAPLGEDAARKVLRLVDAARGTRRRADGVRQLRHQRRDHGGGRSDDRAARGRPWPRTHARCAAWLPTL